MTKQSVLKCARSGTKLTTNCAGTAAPDAPVLARRYPESALRQRLQARLPFEVGLCLFRDTEARA
jgi:hypothetical protein